jgi:hypothetical protein
MNVNDRVKLMQKTDATPYHMGTKLPKGSLGTVTGIISDDDQGLLVQVTFDKLPSRPQHLYATRPAWGFPMLVVVA